MVTHRNARSLERVIVLRITFVYDAIEIWLSGAQFDTPWLLHDVCTMRSHVSLSLQHANIRAHRERQTFMLNGGNGKAG